MVDITDLKSVADMACEFESRWGHQPIRTDMKRRRKPIDPKEYIRIRIDQLVVERTKNDNEVAHMVLDKSIAELSIVLDLLERKAPL